MHQTILSSIELLLAASLIAVVVHWIRIPYSTALVLGGWFLGTYNLLPNIVLAPQMVLWIFLPVLLFESAIHTNLSRLREDSVAVFSLAVPGLLFSMAIIGGVVHSFTHIPWPTALLFGAIMAPTDTVSILSIFKALKLPDRLRAIVEGEALFNDGTAIVVFHALAAATGAGKLIYPLYELGQILLVVTGGLLIGGILGALAALVMRQTHDHLIEIMLTTVLGFGSYILAESFHVSGVIAVVVAGLVVARFAIQEALSPTTQIALGSFWEYAGFVVNSVLFLLIGLQLNLGTLFRFLPAIGVGVLAVLLGRALAIYPTCLILGKRKIKIPLPWQHVMVWGNLKGSLSMVLMLSLPLAYPDRGLLLAMTYGVVLFSLVIQGLSLHPFIRFLKLTVANDFEEEYEINQGALLAAKAVQEELSKLFTQGMLPRAIHNQLRSRYQTYIARANRKLKSLVEAHPVLEEKELKTLSQQMTRLERSVIMGALRDHVIGEEAAKNLLGKLDDRTEEKIIEDLVSREPRGVRGTTPL
ncbi:MAG TPA: sodium:proton antiporter [Cyanobacteria bacterium UBA8530]|nr:sodium:proton antiporter [Cyanobacteria bacterium UBA8530]